MPYSQSRAIEKRIKELSAERREMNKEQHSQQFYPLAPGLPHVLERPTELETPDVSNIVLFSLGEAGPYFRVRSIRYTPGHPTEFFIQFEDRRHTFPIHEETLKSMLLESDMMSSE